jgi:hypothetical protein
VTFFFLVPLGISMVDIDAHILTSISAPLACVLQQQSCGEPQKPVSAASTTVFLAVLALLGAIFFFRGMSGSGVESRARLTRIVIVALSGGLFLSSFTRLADRHGHEVRVAMTKALPPGLYKSASSGVSRARAAQRDALAWIGEKLSTVARTLGLSDNGPTAPRSKARTPAAAASVFADEEHVEEVRLEDE